MRPIVFGVILFFVGMVGWATFDILDRIIITIEYFGSLKFPFLIEMFKFIALLSLPIALALEVLLLLLGKR